MQSQKADPRPENRRVHQCAHGPAGSPPSVTRPTEPIEHIPVPRRRHGSGRRFCMLRFCIDCI